MTHLDPASPSSPRSWHESRRQEAGEELAGHEARMRKLATWRLLAFLGVVAPLLALETTPRGSWPILLGVALLLGVGFVALVLTHRRVRRLRDRAAHRVQLAREGLARMDRRWDGFPAPALAPAPAEHPWAADLDLLGRASLAHLLGTPRTLPGLDRLRAALLDPPADPSVRVDRREAMARLAQEPALLEAVQVAARSVERPGDPEGLSRFLDWAEGPGWKTPPARTRLRLLARILAGANLVLLAGWFGGWPPFWLGTVLLASLLWLRNRDEAHAIFDAVEGAEASLGRWAELLEVAAELPGDTPLLERIRTGASSPVEGARALGDLRRLSDWAQVRRSSLVYFPVAVLLAWDLHPLVPMEGWRERFGPRVRGWLEAVGELELLVAFALFHFEHPAGAVPTEAGHLPQTESPAPGGEPSTPSWKATNLRHPLLHPERAVGNDLEVPAGGELLLVTGSNMSGKSTLLRALGVNQILFLAGGPVAADAYQAPPLPPWTSMRIRDSLAEGVSFFMAELHRLRRVVDAARGGPVLVLLDEILQGTNTAERRTAARIILGHLVAAGARGAVSTHDLTLADAPELAPRLVQVHLREEVRDDGEGGRVLTFDHRLRPGPATSRNALLLLEMVGLGGELPPD
jgi:hypothetical protein